MDAITADGTRVHKPKVFIIYTGGTIGMRKVPLILPSRHPIVIHRDTNINRSPWRRSCQTSSSRGCLCFSDFQIERARSWHRRSSPLILSAGITFEGDDVETDVLEVTRLCLAERTSRCSKFPFWDESPNLVCSPFFCFFGSDRNNGFRPHCM